LHSGCSSLRGAKRRSNLGAMRAGLDCFVAAARLLAMTPAETKAVENLRDIKVVMFDQYGTIVDMQRGLTEFVTSFLARKGWQGKPGSFVTGWRRTHFETSMIDALIDRGHTPYRTIGERAVAYVMDRCGIAYTAAEVRELVAAIERLKPFPD